MREKLNEKVSVVSYYSAKHGHTRPYIIQWKSRDYYVGELGMAHKYKHGDTWIHIFEVVDKGQSISFRLSLDTKELSWTLQVVSDGLPS
jgi:hypothetical protein